MKPNGPRSLSSSPFALIAGVFVLAACGGDVPLGTQSGDGALGTGGDPGTGGGLGSGGAKADAAPGSGGRGGAGGTLVVDAPVGTGGGLQSGGRAGTGGALSSGGRVGTGGQPVTGGALGGGGRTGTGGSTSTTTNPRCGTIVGLTCPAGMFCDLDSRCGMISDAAGTCMPKGGGCLAVSQPVCGCDGKTYDNDCVRINAGVLKASEGSCAAGTGGTTGTGGVGGAGGRGGAGGGGVAGTGGTGALCAPFVGYNCQAGYFCDIPGCTNDAAGNSCVLIPEVCSAVYSPVCGCDGKTYGNDCERQGAQVRKSHDGVCAPGSGGGGGNIGGASGSGGSAGTGGTTATGDKTCGTSGAIKCVAQTEFCDLDSNCGQIANAAGMCRPTGPGVGCIAMEAPVCGCDGKTYSNDCIRAAAGILKASDGACSTDGGSKTYPNGYLAWQVAAGVAGWGPAVVVGPGFADTWDQVSSFPPESPPSSATGTYTLTAAQTDDLFARLASVSTQALPHTGEWLECSISFYFRACAGCAPVRIQHVTAAEVAPEMDSVWLWFDSLLGRSAATNPRNYCVF